LPASYRRSFQGRQAPPPFQFSLRALLLLFVVLGSSLSVFGDWGIMVFVAVLLAAVCLHRGSQPPTRLDMAMWTVVCLIPCPHSHPVVKSRLTLGYRDLEYVGGRRNDRLVTAPVALLKESALIEG